MNWPRPMVLDFQGTMTKDKRDDLRKTSVGMVKKKCQQKDQPNLGDTLVACSVFCFYLAIAMRFVVVIFRPPRM